MQRVGQHVHAVDRRIPHEVDEMHRVELVGERASPVVEHVDYRRAIGDPEGEVEIGESVTASTANEPTTAPATMRSSSFACRSTRSRRASRCSTVNIETGERRAQSPAGFSQPSRTGGV